MRQTTKRAARLARMWLLLKTRSYSVQQLSAEFGVGWQRIYIDLVDLQLSPLEPHWAPMIVSCGQWRVCPIGEEAG